MELRYTKNKCWDFVLVWGSFFFFLLDKQLPDASLDYSLKTVEVIIYNA